MDNASSHRAALPSVAKVWSIDTLGYDGLNLKTRAVPAPQAHQVLVRLKAAALNFRDLKILKGVYGDMNPALPVVPLSDGAGEVVAAGSGVTRFRPGDRVQPIYMEGWHDGPIDPERRGWRAKSADADGVALEYAVYDEADILPIPESLTFAEAACFPCAGVTAWHSVVFFGGVKAGDTILTMGSGGVSLFALQIAKMRGARVIATSSDDAKLARLTSMGASDVVNYRRDENWGDTVRRLTDGRGVDHVVEVGGSKTVERSVRACRAGGSIGVVGNLSGQFAAAGVTESGIRIGKIIVGSRAMNDALLRTCATHGAKPVIDRRFGFDDLKAALRYLEAGEHFGKVVLEF